MNPKKYILRDLLSGQATASAVAEHLSLNEDFALSTLRTLHGQALSTLRTLHGQALVEPLDLGHLTVWRLTAKARQLHFDSATP